MTDSLPLSIISFLRSLHPIAVILHGSRAIGLERPSSDWDIILLYEKNQLPILTSQRIAIGEFNIEWKALSDALSGAEILRAVGPALQHGIVVWEEAECGTDFLARAKSEYLKGPRISAEERERRALFFFRRVQGVSEDADSPHLLHRHVCVAHTSAVNWWFELLHNRFPLPFYLAIPEIAGKDPAYASALGALIGGHPAERVRAAEFINHQLFPPSGG